MSHKKPILLIEDDSIDAMTVRRAFRELKIPNELLLFKNGLEALSYLKQVKNSPPSLILLDLNMPVMNGLEFLLEIKQDQYLQKCPVIVLTTSNEEQDKQDCFKLSVAGYFVKPDNYDDFVSIIKMILSYWEISELPNDQCKSC